MWRPYGVASAWRGSFGVYLATLTLCTTLAGWGAVELFQRGAGYADDWLAADQSARASDRVVVRQGFVALTQDWNERIRTNEFWSGRGAAQSNSGPVPYVSRGNLNGSMQPASIPPSDEAAKFHDGDETTYRTVCVRLCDGYFWPISFSTTEENFAADRLRCESSCGSPARLHVYKNPGEEPDDMRDLDDKPYTKLPTAYLFRTKYQESCKCQAQPWEQQAQDRHKLYALDAQRKKGSKTAAIEAELLKSKMEADRRRQLQADKARPIVSAAIVAANGAATEPNRTLELRPAAPVVLPPKARPKTPPKQASANSGRPAGIMRAGVSSGSGGGSGRSGSASSYSRDSSGAGGDWRVQAFRGN